MLACWVLWLVIRLSDRGGRKISRITKLPVRLVAKLLALLASRRCCLAVVLSWINYLNTKHFMTFHVVTTSSWVSLKLALWLHYIPKCSPISLMMFWDFWANNGLVAQQRFYHSRKLTGVLMIVHCFCPWDTFVSIIKSTCVFTQVNMPIIRKFTFSLYLKPFRAYTHCCWLTSLSLFSWCTC